MMNQQSKPLAQRETRQVTIEAAYAEDRCVSCVLPRQTKGLRFAEDGRCALCFQAGMTKTRKTVRRSERDLLATALERIRHKGASHEYDCVAGVSGGRDSSYMLYELVTQHHLRVLAAYYRTPFTCAVTDANVKRMTRLLNVDLVPMQISQARHAKVARRFIVAWKGSHIAEFANLVCAPCKLVNRELFRIARQNHVPTAMYGGSQYEDFQFGAVQILGRKDEDSVATQFLKLLKVLRKGAKLVLRHPGIILQVPLAFRASVLYLAPHSLYLRMRYSSIDRYNYFRLKPWDEAACNQSLTELGWELPPGCNSTWKADCDMAEAKNIMFRRTKGLSYVDALFSNMIRAGAIARPEAMERAAQEGRLSRERLARLTDALILPRSFFVDVIRSGL